MDQQTEHRILENAEYVRDAVTVLADKRDSLSFEAYQSQREQRDVVEREFQTAIEACIDIGQMILKDETGNVPETNAEVFGTLGELGLIGENVAERMAQAAGFRNVLTHRYGNDIDDKDVYNVLQHDLPIFREFLVQVRDILN